MNQSCQMLRSDPVKFLIGAQFISCDEKLLKKCLIHKIKVWCGNPVSFCEKEGLK